MLRSGELPPPLPLTMSSWGPWIECFVLAASAASSAWLLSVCSPSSALLSRRQLWHLGAADLAHSAVQIFYAQIAHDILALPVPTLRQAVMERTAIHFCLFMLCLVEVQLAATVLASSMRHFGMAECLGKVLPYSWLLSAALMALDCETLAENTIVRPSGQVTGAAPVVATVMGICFLLTTLLYVAAVAHLWRTRSSNKLLLNASLQALVYPLNFLLTVFPTWLTHKQIISDEGYGAHHLISSVCLYSNGWVNALTYSWQSSQFGKQDDPGGIVPALDASLLDECQAIGFRF
eukprot:TRINITY_DN84669_c0_g1_i1.p1 TRINITY_DN84669_c0_g1~~TRINITY_DN84669_c0_g1_i1.p1  ORF type:complete len:300 (-),score=55.67 TRINITY_DN84669_c0_g1_i1:1-876(-)